MAIDADAVSLTLTAIEADALGTVLRDALAGLREEIYKTEKFAWRQELKQRETLLAGLLDRLPAFAG
jgi:hypothetical protein